MKKVLEFIYQLLSVFHILFWIVAVAGGLFVIYKGIANPYESGEWIGKIIEGISSIIDK